MKRTITIILILGLFFLSGCISKEGTYDYCVEWSGFIHRSNLDYQCYVIGSQDGLSCAYEIEEDDTLITSFYNMNDAGEPVVQTRNEYECSRYVKSLVIETKEI